MKLPYYTAHPLPVTVLIVAAWLPGLGYMYQRFWISGLLLVTFVLLGLVAFGMLSRRERRWLVTSSRWHRGLALGAVGFTAFSWWLLAGSLYVEVPVVRDDQPCRTEEGREETYLRSEHMLKCHGIPIKAECGTDKYTIRWLLVSDWTRAEFYRRCRPQLSF